MEQSTYDPCLSKTIGLDNFSIIYIKTDDTLLLADIKFAEQENFSLLEGGFLAKPHTPIESGPTISLNRRNIIS